MPAEQFDNFPARHVVSNFRPSYPSKDIWLSMAIETGCFDVENP